MRTNLNQLQVFYLAARAGSMAEAARRLCISKPAVSMQIKKLEQCLGAPVFEREPGALRLTQRGRGLYAAAKPIFRHADRLEQYLREAMRAEETELRFGAHHVPARYFLPDLFAHVRARYADLKVRMELDAQDNLLEKLLQQELDLAVMIGDPPEQTRCVTTRLFDMEMILVVSACGELGNISSLSAGELGSIPLILQQKGTGALREVLRFLRQHRVAPKILLENLSSDVIKKFLLKMPAGALISRFIVQRELDEGLLHEIKILEGPPLYHFNLVYGKYQHPPMKLRHFLAGVPGFTPKF